MNTNIYEKERPPITASIRRAIEVEAGHACSIKGCNEHTYLEIHHINENREDNKHSNLILLCDKHHKMAHAKKIDRKALKDYKNLLNGKATTEIIEETESDDINIKLTEQFTLEYNDNDIKSLVQDLIFLANSNNDFKINCFVEENNNNLKRLSELQQKELSTIEKDERNFLQERTKAFDERLRNINNSIKILFIGCTQNYSKMDFDTEQGISAVNGLFESYNNYQDRKKIDIWKDNKIGLSAPIYLTQEDIEILLKHLDLKDIEGLKYGPFYVYEMPTNIRIEKAIPKISRELWYQIDIEKRTEEDMMQEFNPSGWKFGLG